MKQPYNTTIYNTALYMRLSRDDELQGESGSIQTQRMMLRQYAAEHGLNVIDEYIDDGWSGTNFDRPDFQRMIDDIEDGKIIGELSLPTYNQNEEKSREMQVNAWLTSLEW